MVGADVAAEPNGFAGEAVPSGAVMGTAEMVPGTVHPPYSPSSKSPTPKPQNAHHKKKTPTSLGLVFTNMGVQPWPARTA